MENKCLTGKNGFLFLNNDTNNVIKQHSGDLLFSKSDLDKWKSTIESRIDYFANKNIPYFIQLSPDKHRIYSEMLPDNIVLSDLRPSIQFEKLIDKIGISNNYLNPLSLIINKKNEGLVCHKTDTHWNARGAYAAYEQFIDRIENILAVKKCEERYIENEKAGDLGCKLIPAMKSTFVETKIAKHKNLIYYNEVENTGGFRLFVNENIDNELICVVFGSSSVHEYYIDYLSESFKKVYFIWEHAIDYSIFEYISADVVLSLVRERYIIKPVDDKSSLSFIDKTIIKNSFDDSGDKCISIFKSYFAKENDDVDLATKLKNIYIKTNAELSLDRKYAILFSYVLASNGLIFESEIIRKKYAINMTEYRQLVGGEKQKNEMRTLKRKAIEITLFDEDYYKETYQDIKRKQVDPFLHYINHGWKEGRNPSDKFNTKFYLEKYPDIKKAKVNPLIHYLKTGIYEGRHPIDVNLLKYEVDPKIRATS